MVLYNQSNKTVDLNFLLALTNNNEFGAESGLAKAVGQFEVVCSRILDFSTSNGQGCHVVDDVNIESSVHGDWALKLQA